MLVACCTEGSCTALLVPHVRVSVKHYFVLIVSIGLSLTILKVFTMSVFRFSIDSFAILIAEDGTLLLKVPLGSGKLWPISSDDFDVDI